MAALVVTNSIAQAVQCGHQKSNRLSWLQFQYINFLKKMIHFFLETNMENQVNVGDQNTQQIGQNPVAQPTVLDKPKANFAVVFAVALVCSVVFGVGGYFLGMKSSKSTQNNESAQAQPTAIPTSNVNLTPTPTMEKSNLKTYTSSNQSYVPNSFFQKFPNFKNDIPSKLTFTYPNTWEVFKIDSTPYNKTILMFSLHKNDPRFSNCRSEGPCENFADMQFRIGMTDSTIQDFDQNFWGSGYPIAKTNKTTINGVEVVQVFNTDTSPFPMGSLYKIASDAQVNITSEFFNYNDQNNQTDYSKQTIQEINQILSSLNFSN